MDSVPRGAGAPPHYPWHRWADGSSWKLIWGEDYYVSDKAFRAAATHTPSHTVVAALGLGRVRFLRDLTGSRRALLHQTFTNGWSR